MAARQVPSAALLANAAIDALAEAKVFKTLRSAPLLDAVTIVEPAAGREAATLRFFGPKGRGTLHVLVAQGMEDLKGDQAGWADFLTQMNASPALVAAAPRLARRWYETRSPVGFTPTLAGVGHVLCIGTGCSLAGAKVLAYGRRSVISVPAIGGELVLGPGPRRRPLALIGAGALAGIRLRFAYPDRVPPLVLPPSASPLPTALGG